MEEIVTEAVILNSTSRSNGDRRVNFFTKLLGRIEATAKSGMNTNSKLSLHLDDLNLSEIRLVNKNRFLITDALTKNRFDNLRSDPENLERAFKAVSVVGEISPINLPDPELWYYLNESLKKSHFNYKILLKILGYDPKLATCVSCSGKNVTHFIYSEQSFVCKKCSKKIIDDKLLTVHA